MNILLIYFLYNVTNVTLGILIVYVLVLEQKNVHFFTWKVLPALNFANCKIKKLSWRQVFADRLKISQKLIPRKMENLKLQPSSTFKMTYLVIKNFKWAPGSSSHILDKCLVSENKYFVCNIYIVAVSRIVRVQTVKFCFIYGL